MQYSSFFASVSSFASISSSLCSRRAALSLAAGAALALGLAAVPAHAQTKVTTRAGITGGDVIDWSQAGADGVSVASPTTVTDTKGHSAVVSDQTGGRFERLNQSTGWGGSFAPGDALLWNQGAGAITFSFVQGISGIGTQIQSDYYGAYTAQLQTYGKTGNLLSTVTTTGTATSNGDNSAAFLGVVDPTADIYKATFSLTAAPSSSTADFAINTVSLTPAAVPEASTTVSLGLLLTLGLGGLVVAAKRRKAAA